MLLLIKVRNSVELFWETLDSSERATVLYALAWVVIVTVTAVARKASEDRVERIKQELRAELLEEPSDRR